jgi:hypothetical protein
MKKNAMAQLEQNKLKGWKIKKAWLEGEYVIIEYANGMRDNLYQGKLEWIKEMEPKAEIVW